MYEQTLDEDERIPWEWIERSVSGRGGPEGWRRHLLLAGPDDDPNGLNGYAFGSFLPGFGGYLCYVGVDPTARRSGVGTRLFEEFFRRMRADARRAGEPLPFVLWESHRPDGDTPADRDLWAARVRLFDRVGGKWVEGIDFQSPSWSDDEDAEPIPLQLFVKPEDVPAGQFDADRLRGVVAGLHRRVYKNGPDHPLYRATLPPGNRPRLVPAREAAVAAVVV